jgi:hypothetical protein
MSNSNSFSEWKAETHVALQTVADEAKAKLDAFLVELLSGNISDKDFVDVLKVSIMMSGIAPRQLCGKASIDSETFSLWYEGKSLPPNQFARKVYLDLFFHLALQENGLVKAMDNLSNCKKEFFVQPGAEIPPESMLTFDPWKMVVELEFSIRTENSLKNERIVYLGQLVQNTESELLRTPNFGRMSLGEVKEGLREKFGLTLGMCHPALDAFNQELCRRQAREQ